MVAAIRQGGHLLIYRTDPAMQSALERAGVAGQLAPSEPESLVVAVNNAAAHKVDFFGSRQFEHAVELRADGIVRTRLTAEFTNEAPTEGLPRRVLGPQLDFLEAGDNLSYVTVLCGTTCTFLEVPAGASDGGREFGRPAYDLSLLVPAGSQQTLVYETETDGGWWWEDDRMIIEVEHLLASTLFGTDLSVRVAAPDGMHFVSLPHGATVDSTTPNEAVWGSTLSGRVLLRFELEAQLVPIRAAKTPWKSGGRALLVTPCPEADPNRCSRRQQRPTGRHRAGRGPRPGGDLDADPDDDEPVNEAARSPNVEDMPVLDVDVRTV